MFPSPQAALPLPPGPSIERYRKIAKSLVKACRSNEPAVIRAWASSWVQALVRLSGLTITPGLPVDLELWIDNVEVFARAKLFRSAQKKRQCSLADAQFVIARSHGFGSWPKFVRHLEELTRSGSSVASFEAAAEAVISGDIAALKRLLRDQPELIHARSLREHGATLLHYISANGVEGYRQKTPPNIVDIAELLLESGAAVGATAKMYGGASTPLDLTATSVHPERAGVQRALLRLLLEYGANNDSAIVISAVANGRQDAAEFLAQNGALLDFASAAAVGRLDLVRTYFTRDTALQPEQLRRGFLYASACGRHAVIQFLLQKGADLAAHDNNGQTALHLAAIGAHLDTVKLLLKHEAPLELKNSYEGTVLGQALWSAAHSENPTLYLAVLDLLVSAGAHVPHDFLLPNQALNEWLQRNQQCRCPACRLNPQ